MKLSKDDKVMLRKEYLKVWGRDESMVEHCVKCASGYVDFGDVLYVMDKPHVKTDFWFGEHTYDYDEVCERRDEASKSEKYFIRENIERNCKAQDFIDCIDGKCHGTRKAYLFKKQYTCQDEDCRLGYVRFVNLWDSCDLWDIQNRECREMTDDEVGVLREFCECEVAKFEKRLRTYLKRYGLSKCHFGVYWADR